MCKESWTLRCVHVGKGVCGSVCAQGCRWQLPFCGSEATSPGGQGGEGCGLDKSRSPHPCSGRSSSQDVPAGGYLTSHVEGVLRVISSLALCGKGSWYKKFQGEMGWALGEDTARRLILWASQACSLAVFWRLSALHGINSREVSPTGVEAAGCGRRRKNKGEE